MATNADKADLNAEEDLKKAKEESETTKVEETEQGDEAQSDDNLAEDSKDESEATFTKGVPSIPGDTPEEYYANLEKSYQASTGEALRLKGEVDKLSLTKSEEKLASETGVLPSTTPEEELENLTPEQLYIRGKQKEETDKAFAEVVKDYPQVLEQDNYQKFVTSAAVFGRAILLNDKRFASPDELYRKTIIDLGWDREDSKEKLGSALKDGAASTRTGTASSPSKSKVTDAMIAANLKMYPDKTRAEIIKELEPHIT